MSAQSKPPTVFDELRMRLERSRQRDYQRKRDSCRRPSTPNTKPVVTILTTTTATNTTTNQFEYLARKPWASTTPPATHSSPPAEHSPRYSATSSPLYRPRSPSPLQHSPRYSPKSPQFYPNTPGEPSTANRVSPSSSTTSTPPRHPAGLLFSAKNDIDLQDYEPENISRRLPSPYTASSTVHSSPRLSNYDPATGYSTPARPTTSTVAVLSPVPARRLSPQKRYSSIHNSPIHPILAQRTPLSGHVLPPIDPRRASLAPPSISPHPLSLYHSSSSTASTSSSRSRPVRPLPSRFVVAAESRSPVIRALGQRLPPIAHLLEHVVDEPKNIFRPAINPMWGSYAHQSASSRGQKRRHSELDVDLEVEDYGRHGACTRASDCDCNGRRVRKRRYVVIVEEHCPCASDEHHLYPAPTHSRLPRLPSLSSTISSSGSISQLVTPLSTPEAGSSVEHPICIEDEKTAAGPLPVKCIKRPVF